MLQIKLSVNNYNQILISEMKPQRKSTIVWVHFALSRANMRLMALSIFPHMNLKMAVYILVNGIKAKRMVEGSNYDQMGQFMKAIGVIIWQME